MLKLLYLNICVAFLFSYYLYFQYTICNCHFWTLRARQHKNRRLKKFNNFAETIIFANKHSLQKNNIKLSKAFKMIENVIL